MGKFTDIYTIIADKANELGVFNYKSITEFANVTQKTESGTILIFLNPDNLPGTYDIPSVVQTDFDFDIWVVKQHNLEGNDLDIAVVQDACISVMSQFLYELSVNIQGYSPLEGSTFRLVKHTTPNAFAGVRFLFKISTSCNAVASE